MAAQPVKCKSDKIDSLEESLTFLLKLKPQTLPSFFIKISEQISDLI